MKSGLINHQGEGLHSFKPCSGFVIDEKWLSVEKWARSHARTHPGPVLIFMADGGAGGAGG